MVDLLLFKNWPEPDGLVSVCSVSNTNSSLQDGRPDLTVLSNKWVTKQLSWWNYRKEYIGKHKWNSGPFTSWFQLSTISVTQLSLNCSTSQFFWALLGFSLLWIKVCSWPWKEQCDRTICIYGPLTSFRLYHIVFISSKSVNIYIMNINGLMTPKQAPSAEVMKELSYLQKSTYFRRFHHMY